MVSTTDFIAAIELSSSKIAGVVGKKNGDGSIQVLAYAKEDSPSCIRKGVIFNLDKTASTLTTIINRLESEINGAIGKVYVGISGQSLHSQPNTVARNLKEDTVISQDLIDSLFDENINTKIEQSDILDVIPQEYKVGNTLSVEPIGVPATYIEGNFMNIVARASIKKNLERAFQLANIQIADIFIAPTVTAKAILTESEMRSGSALIDMGADTTTVSIFKGNILRFISVVPLGGNSITHDLTALNIEEQEAEKVKIKYGNLTYMPESDSQQTIQTEDSRTTLDLAVLNDVIEARVEEIIANAWNQIERSGYSDKLLAGVVLTGGTANLKNIAETFRRRSKVEKIRIAADTNFDVKTAQGAEPNEGKLNTLFGLVATGTENCYQPTAEEAKAPKDLFEDDEELKIRMEEERIKIEKEKKEAEKKKKEKPKKPAWWKATIDKLSHDIFSDDDMK